MQPEKPVEKMSVDELVAAATETPKPKPKPRTRQLRTLDKPVEEMSVDDLIAAANEPEHDQNIKPDPASELESVRGPEPTVGGKPSDEESDWDQQSSAGDQVGMNTMVECGSI